MERFRATEVLFHPSLIGREQDGLHQWVHDAIMHTDAECRAELWKKIVLAGGTTLFGLDPISWTPHERWIGCLTRLPKLDPLKM